MKPLSPCFALFMMIAGLCSAASAEDFTPQELLDNDVDSAEVRTAPAPQALPAAVTDRLRKRNEVQALKRALHARGSPVTGASVPVVVPKRNGGQQTVLVSPQKARQMAITPKRARPASETRASRDTSERGIGGDWYYQSVGLDFTYYDYVNSLNYRFYTYYAPYGTENIEVDFAWTDLEYPYDRVDLYDSYGLCASYSGSHSSFISSTCTGNQIDIWVVTDGSIDGESYDGFAINGFHYFIPDVTSPNHPPVAIGYASPSSAEQDETIYFYGWNSYDVDMDDDLLQFEWRFGDGDYSYARNPTHVYSQPGVYNVRLIVSDGYYDSEDTFTVTIYPRLPEARFSVNATLIAMSNPLKVTPTYDFRANLFQLDWGDGAVQALTRADRLVQHYYTAPGVYTVVMTAWNDVGADSAYLSIQVTDEEIAPRLALVNQTTLDNRQGKQYTVNPRYQYSDDGHITAAQVDFGDGSPSVTLPWNAYQTTANHAYQLNGQNRAGVYSILASVTDNAGLVTTHSYVFETKNLPPKLNKRVKIKKQCALAKCTFDFGPNVTTAEQAFGDADGAVKSFYWDFFKKDKVTPVTACKRGLELTARCDFGATGVHHVRLTLVDNAGKATAYWVKTPKLKLP
ncbi:MAG: PKD domain-containing protein [Bacteriovoracia bacterium]